MTLLLKPHRWRSKPPVGGRIDWDNSLSDGLLAFIFSNEGAGQVSDLVAPRYGSGAVWKDSIHGKMARGWTFSQEHTANLNWTSGPFTVAALFLEESLAGGALDIFGRMRYGSSSDNEGWSLLSRGDAFAGYHFLIMRDNGNTFYDFVCPTPRSIGLHLLVGTSDGTTKRIYLDGKFEASGTVNVVPVSQTTNGLYGSISSDIYTIFGLCANREWSSSEVWQLWENPYDIIARTAPKLWIGAPFSLDLSAYRWRDDDNNEALASYLAAENTAVSRAKEQNVRLRVQIDADGDPSSQQYKLQYRRSGNTEWIDVEP